MSDDKIVLLAKFPHKKLTLVAESGNTIDRRGLARLQKELNANASSIKSRSGGALYGHAALTYSPDAYALLTNGLPYVIPIQPPEEAVIPPGTNAANRTALLLRHVNDLAAYDLHVGLDQILRALLIDAVPEICISDLDHRVHGFRNVTTLTLLTHLWTHYGQISEADISMNGIRMGQDWHPTSNFQTLVRQLQLGNDFATDANMPIADVALAHLGYELVNKTGVFAHACWMWRGFDAAEKTFDHFCTHFRKAWNDRHSTMESAGFNAAHAVIPAVTPVDELKAEIVQLKAALASKKRTPVDYTKAPTHYCWTHGTGYNPAHTSATCSARKTNAAHQITATASNKLGGSDKIHHRTKST
jgi:hypothetical protein